MEQQIKNSFFDFIIPTNRDNLNQIALKLIFIISLVLLIVFSSIVAIYFVGINKQQAILTENKQIFTQFASDENGHHDNALKYFKKQNNDLRGWISIKNTDLSAPVFQTNDNNFYKKHNQFKEKSRSGSLFFDSKDKFSKEDKNLIIYGKNEQQLFSCLQNYKSMYFLSNNPVIEFSTLDTTDRYTIFSVFIINSKLKDDNNYIFNYKKSTFKDDADFSVWYNEIIQRSLYNTDIPVTTQDNFITLITDSSEFNGAKLVIMAKKLNKDEIISNFSIGINKKPRYPQAYYDIKGIKNPFNIKEENNVS